MLDRMTETGQTAQQEGTQPAIGVLDKPDVNAAGWVWGDEGAKAPLDAPLSALMSVAARLVGAFVGCAAQGMGASPAGLGVMRLLAARDGLKSSEVAARGWWTAGTVTSLVDTLVRDGYVERRRDPDDRRGVRLYLTQQGRHNVAESVAQTARKGPGALASVARADERVIGKFLGDTIELFGKLVGEERGR